MSELFQAMRTLGGWEAMSDNGYESKGGEEGGGGGKKRGTETRRNNHKRVYLLSSSRMGEKIRNEKGGH